MAGPGVSHRAVAALDEFRTPRPLAGWRVLLTAFCMALVAWGLGFYSLSVYVQYLARRGRFSPALLSAATTFHFLVGAAALYVMEAAATRFGRRRVVVAGVLLMAGCASALAYVPNAFWLFAAYAGMAFGWAAISGTAITQIIGQWFHDRRGLALNVALTGASAAGFVVVPALVAAIARFGMGPGVALMAGVLALLMLALIASNLVEPDARAATAAQAAAAARPPTTVRCAWIAHLLRLCALFGIGWLAQVAFLAQQLPLLVPRIGAAHGHRRSGGDDRQLAARPAGTGQLHGPHRPPPRHRLQLRPAGRRHGADAGQRRALAGSSPAAAWWVRRSATSSRCRRCSRSANSHRSTMAAWSLACGRWVR